jgi:hypothetical protein
MAGDLHGLFEKIEQAMSDVTDPNLWDGDESAEWIYAQFLEWLPDMISHRNAETIRTYSGHREFYADMIDPFVLRDGEWVRKRDGRPVPERVATPQEGN